MNDNEAYYRWGDALDKAKDYDWRDVIRLLLSGEKPHPDLIDMLAEYAIPDRPWTGRLTRADNILGAYKRCMRLAKKGKSKKSQADCIAEVSKQFGLDDGDQEGGTVANVVNYRRSFGKRTRRQNKAAREIEEFAAELRSHPPR
jgi:hypothetical protein